MKHSVKRIFFFFLLINTSNIYAEAVGIDVFGPFNYSRDGGFDEGGDVRADGTSFWFYEGPLVDENFDWISPVGQDVSVSVTGNAIATISCGVTPGEGCTAEITNTLAESVFATMTINGIEIALPTNEGEGLIFTNLPVASNTTFTRTGSFTPDANGIDSTTFKFQINDINNEPLSFGDDEFIVTSSRNAQLIDFIDNKDGTYSVTLINLTAETVNLSISVNGEIYNDIATVTFNPIVSVAGPASAADTVISSNGFNLQANGSDVWRVSIQLVDANGIKLNSGGDLVQASVSGDAAVSSVLDKNDGTYELTVTNTTPERVDLSITVNGVIINNVASISFLASAGIGPAIATNTIVNVAGFDLIANGTDTWVVTIQLVDSNGIMLNDGGDTIEVIVSGNATVDSVIDNNDGSYTANITSTTAQTTTLDIIINGATLNSVVSTIFMPGPFDVSETQITNSNNSDGTVDLVIQLADSNGNFVTSGGADIIVETTGGASASAVTDNGDGTYLATIANAAGGTSDISLTVDGQASGVVLAGLDIPGEPEPEPVTPLNLGSGGGGSFGWLTLALLGLGYKRKYAK